MEQLKTDKYLLTSYLALLFGALVFLAGFLPALLYGAREGALTIALILALIFVAALAVGGIGYTRRPRASRHEHFREAVEHVQWMHEDPAVDEPLETRRFRAPPTYAEPNVRPPDIGEDMKEEEESAIRHELREREADRLAKDAGE